MARGSWINESVCTESERERLLKYVGKKFSEDFIILEYIDNVKYVTLTLDFGDGEIIKTQISRRNGEKGNYRIITTACLDEEDVQHLRNNEQVESIEEEVCPELNIPTILDKILEIEINAWQNRLNKLTAINAPEIMLVKLRENIENAKKGIIKITDKEDLLSIHFKEYEVKKGRGGVPYIQFNGSINYFPEGKYGKFIKSAI